MNHNHKQSIFESVLYSVLTYILVIFVTLFFLKMGAEKRPSWEDLLCRPQYKDYYLGKTTATTPWVSVLIFFPPRKPRELHAKM